jgi:hypothetical protein
VPTVTFRGAVVVPVVPVVAVGDVAVTRSVATSDWSGDIPTFDDDPERGAATSWEAEAWGTVPTPIANAAAAAKARAPIGPTGR